MKKFYTVLLMALMAMRSFSQELNDYLELIKSRDKNDSLVKGFDLGTAPRVVPPNHYFKIEYLLNGKGGMENEIAFAMETKGGAFSYKNFSAKGFPAMIYAGTRMDYMGQPLPGTMDPNEYPMSSMPVYFPESFTLAAVNEKTTIHVAIYKFSKRNMQRLDSIKALPRNKGNKDLRSRAERVKEYLASEEAQRVEKVTKKNETEIYNENMKTILQLEKEVNDKYIIESKLKKKVIFNKGYEVLYLRYLKIQTATARLTNDKIVYQNRSIALFRKMIAILDKDTKEMEKKLEDQKDIMKIQSIFDSAQ